ncbi:hypothetical protein [Nafulsella turpanensis]|uniref:hypothetical protein n=1 Tax=Nafulsella turpanensis TaxID=1265690 RepID=UPI00034CFF33|nr:hypothetical protein [Nafulsella turpanensis]
MEKDTKEQKVLHLPKDSPLTQEAVEKFNQLISFSPPLELRENLLEVYLTYIIFAQEAPPLNFDRIAENMYWLIQFFRQVEEAMKKEAEE